MFPPSPAALGQGAEEDVKKHKWFTGVNWAHLPDQTPPIQPTVAGASDTSNFE
jgi:hypothetical protein